jgi:tripartite ATP-independent transporter DctM subunit
MVLTLFLSFAVFMLVGMPISFAICVSSIVTVMTHLPQVDLTLVVQRVFAGMDSFPLMCIPFFVLTGELMAQGNITDRLIKMANIFVGRIRGGLAHVNILASMLFGGVSGSSSADVSSIGTILIPTMAKAGYSMPFSVAVTASSATLGIIIPPSNSMIIYAMVAGTVSISQLFLAGIVPGILIGISFMVVSYIAALRHNYRSESTGTWRDKLVAFGQGAVPMLTFVIIIGGILGGVFTPTESSAVAALYALILSVVVYKTVSLKQLPKILLKTALTTATVLFLIGVSNIFGWILAYGRVPQIISNLLTSITMNKHLLMIMIFGVLIVVGTFMDLAAALIIFVPIFLPVVQSVGVDPVHFGLFMITALAIGGYTPPVGVTLFLSCNIGKISLMSGAKACLPFIGAAIVVEFLIIFIPEITMFIPHLLT